MEAADLYIGSTQALCDHAAAVTGMPTRRYANGVGELMGIVADRAVRRPRAPGPLRIGYFSGTTTHDEDWATVEPAVAATLRAHDDVELWLGGHLRTGPGLEEFGDRVRRLPMLPWHELPGVLRDVDINLAPLVPGNRFNEAKSAIKWSEAALVGTPTVATPTQPYRELVEDGLSGFLPVDAAAWAPALDLLVGDAAERARMGSRARREALLRLSPALQARAYLSALHEAARRRAADGPREVTSGWERVADDEPWQAHTLEPYTLGGVRVHAPAPPPSRLGRLARRAATVYRTEGAAALARRGAAAVRRRLRR